MFSSTLFPLLSLAGSIVNASPLQYVDEIAKPRAVLTTSSHPICPGRQNAYSALLSYTAASSLCSSLLPITTVTVTSGPFAGAAVKKNKFKSTSTSLVVVTKIATSTMTVTQTPVNPRSSSPIMVTKTAYKTTTITNTIGGTPSACLAPGSKRKRSPAVYRSKLPKKLAIPPPSPPAAVLCPESDGQTITTNGTSYLIRCYLDHYGGDIGSAITATFLDCLSTCSSISGCVDVSYVPFDYYHPTTSSGTCWMKGSTLSPLIPNGAVWSAEVVNNTSPPATTSQLPQPTLPSSLQSFGTSRLQAACSCLQLPTPTTTITITTPPFLGTMKTLTKTSILKSTTTTTATLTLPPSTLPSSQTPQTQTTTTTLTTTLTTTTSLTTPLTATATPTLFYLRTSPFQSYIAANSGGYDLVLSSLSTTSSAPNTPNTNPPNTGTGTINFHCPNCANSLPPALHAAAPASLFSLSSQGVLTIADVPGEPYAGYELSDWNDGEEFYQSDLSGPERTMMGSGECCWITVQNTLSCAWSGGGGGVGGEEIIWAICYGGAVFRGTEEGLRLYESEMDGWADVGQGVSPGCVRVDVAVVPA